MLGGRGWLCWEGGAGYVGRAGLVVLGGRGWLLGGPGCLCWEGGAVYVGRAGLVVLGERGWLLGGRGCLCWEGGAVCVGKAGLFVLGGWGFLCWVSGAVCVPCHIRMRFSVAANGEIGSSGRSNNAHLTVAQMTFNIAQVSSIIAQVTFLHYCTSSLPSFEKS